MCSLPNHIRPIQPCYFGPFGYSLGSKESYGGGLLLSLLDIWPAYPYPDHYGLQMIYVHIQAFAVPSFIHTASLGIYIDIILVWL